jgi:hypothetical protein
MSDNKKREVLNELLKYENQGVVDTDFFENKYKDDKETLKYYRKTYVGIPLDDDDYKNYLENLINNISSAPAPVAPTPAAPTPATPATPAPSASADADAKKAEAEADKAKAEADKAKAEARQAKAEADKAKAEARQADAEARRVEARQKLQDAKEEEERKFNDLETNAKADQEYSLDNISKIELSNILTKNDEIINLDKELKKEFNIEKENELITKKEELYTELKKLLTSLNSLIENDIDLVKLQVSRENKELNVILFGSGKIDEKKLTDSLIKILPSKEYENIFKEYFKVRKSISNIPIDPITIGGFPISFAAKTEKQITFEKLKSIGEKLKEKNTVIITGLNEGIKIGDTVKCEYTFDKLRSNQIRIGRVLDIYTENFHTILKYKNDSTGKTHTNKIGICKNILNSEADKIILEKQQENERTSFITAAIADNLGFKVGETITCRPKNSNLEIKGVATKFKYNILKRKTYVILDKIKDDKPSGELETFNVNYCLNGNENLLFRVDKLKQKKYVDKQIDRLKKIIKQINTLNINDENYDIKLRNLNNEYITIRNQIKESIDSAIAADAQNKNPKDPATVLSSVPAAEIDSQLRTIKNTRSMLLEQLKQLNPRNYNNIRSILDRPGPFNTRGGQIYGSINHHTQKAGDSI